MINPIPRKASNKTIRAAVSISESILFERILMIHNFKQQTADRNFFEIIKNFKPTVGID
jgi:hypothetical protein